MDSLVNRIVRRNFKNFSISIGNEEEKTHIYTAIQRPPPLGFGSNNNSSQFLVYLLTTLFTYSQLKERVACVTPDVYKIMFLLFKNQVLSAPLKRYVCLCPSDTHRLCTISVQLTQFVYFSQIRFYMRHSFHCCWCSINI